MKYIIKNGRWYDLEHTRGEVVIERYENERLVDTIPFGLDKSDTAQTTKDIFLKIENENIQLEENQELLIVAGRMPLPEGLVIKDGHLWSIEEERRKYRERIRNRVEELNNGYNQARGRRSEVFKRNIERKIDNLLAAEERKDFLDVDLSEVEDETA